MMQQALRGTSKETSSDLTMEPTNVAWFAVAVYLRREYPQVKIYRIKFEKVQDLRKFYRKHTKTDSLDAKTLAKIPVVDFDSLEEVYSPQGYTCPEHSSRHRKQNSKMSGSTNGGRSITD